MILRLKSWAKSIKRDVVALWLAARDPRTPRYVKLLAGAVAAYALSPIDLIPDYIPVLGYLDDLIIVPLGIMVAVALMPDSLMEEFRKEANARAERPVSKAAALTIAIIWVVMALATAWAAWVYFGFGISN